ncbi:MAG: phage portal protein [Beijerinckiaceae bacterium]
MLRWPFKKSVPEKKDYQPQGFVAVYEARQALWSARNHETFTHLGYMKNPIVFRCVRLIAEAVAHVPFMLMAGGRALDTHPMTGLMDNPNPRQDRHAFLEALTAHLLISGNAYAQCVFMDGLPRELHVLRPERMKLIAGQNGWPDAYEYHQSGTPLRFRQECNPITPILHLANFHPMDDYFGFSPMQAAMDALELHNKASEWNKSLLDNSARPSGALVYSGADGAHMSDTQFERLKAELEDNFQGSRNVGRPLLLEGGLDWKPLSLSPQEMDFLAAKNNAAREIAFAFGVPPMMLGLPGDNTYANYQEANRAFWRQTVAPLAQKISNALMQWLTPAWPDAKDVRMEPDFDAVPGMNDDRKPLWERILAAGSLLTVEERREALGYSAEKPVSKYERS